MGIRFSGINIMATDPVRTFAFYEGIGLPVQERESPDSEWYGATFRLTEGEKPAVLWIWRHHEGDPKPQNLIVINCEDMDATYAMLKERGYAVEPPVMQFYGGREMQLSDPDGNHILFLD